MKNKATYTRKNQPHTQKDILSSFKLSHLERTNNKTNSLEEENSQLIDSFELIINNQQGLRNKCLDNNNLLLTDVEGNQNHSYLPGESAPARREISGDIIPVSNQLLDDADVNAVDRKSVV